MSDKISTWMGKEITPDNFSKEELIAIIQRLGGELKNARVHHLHSLEMQSMFRNGRNFFAAP